MSKKKSYQSFTGFIVLLFFYVLSTEGVDRYIETFRMYSDLKEKESAIRSPEQLNLKRSDLIAKRDRLLSVYRQRSNRFEQSQAGVLEYLSTNAKANDILIQALTPVEVKSTDEMKEVPFKMNANSSYHKIGAFINAIETEGIPISIKRIDLSSETTKLSGLSVSIEGKAYILASHEQ